jgi:hypothetical protein
VIEKRKPRREVSSLIADDDDSVRKEVYFLEKRTKGRRLSDWQPDKTKIP